MSQLKKDADVIELLVSPTTQRFQAMRRFILSNADYDPASDDLRALDRLLRNRQFLSVIELSECIRDVWQLSPKYHFLTGNAAFECGDFELGQQSQQLFQLCLEFLLESGDGSPQEPYEITYFSDAQDILAILDVDVRCQKMVKRDGQIFDVATLHDGHDIWFNVDQLNKKLSHANRERANIAV